MFISGILMVFISFIIWISQAGWGGTCGVSVESGYYLTLFGSLLVLTATIISMHGSKRKDQSAPNNLLDQD